jgi:hypothetical protein
MTLMKLRFTIRDLLWLLVVAAIALGWWLDHREQTASYQAVVAKRNATIVELSNRLSH